MKRERAQRLVPPDKEQCQSERREGTFMTLGGSTERMTRCTKRPLWIVTEDKPGRDGKRGSMSLCGACYAIFLDFFRTAHTAKPIRRER